MNKFFNDFFSKIFYRMFKLTLYVQKFLMKTKLIKNYSKLYKFYNHELYTQAHLGEYAILALKPEVFII